MTPHTTVMRTGRPVRRWSWSARDAYAACSGWAPTRRIAETRARRAADWLGGAS